MAIESSQRFIRNLLEVVRLFLQLPSSRVCSKSNFGRDSLRGLLSDLCRGKRAEPVRARVREFLLRRGWAGQTREGQR